MYEEAVVTWITNTIARLDLNAYKADYYDPTQKASDVARKHGVNPSIQGQVIRALGWQTRKEANCCMAKARSDGNGHRPTQTEGVRQAYGCNAHCRFWQHCIDKRPTPLPCEVYIFDDESIPSDPDSAVYYRTSFEASIYV